MKLTDELAKTAKKHGICEDWYNELINERSIDKLLEMYIKGIDFCLSNDYPSNDFIAKNFKGKMERFGIHLDECLEVVNSNKVVSLGKCFGTIEVDDYNVCEIFVKHNSEIVVLASGNSFVMIDIFDSSKVTVMASDEARVCINRYGGKIYKTNSDESFIKVVEKNKKTY